MGPGAPVCKPGEEFGLDGLNEVIATYASDALPKLTGRFSL
jgi:hypothetical protein